MRAKVKILGVEIDNITLKEAVERVLTANRNGQKLRVVTPNPEILLKAAADRRYFEVVRTADLKLADGAGLLWAARFDETTKGWPRFAKAIFLPFSLLWFLVSKRSPLVERVTGTDLVEALVRQAGGAERIFFLGAAEGVAEAAKMRLYNKYKNECVVGVFAGSPTMADEEEIVRRVNDSGANILFVAYGAPAQEFWIARNLAQMPGVNVAVGVGGAFDFHAGKITRAPEWMRKVGLEWLYRLVRQPGRLKRIWNATVVFAVRQVK